MSESDNVANDYALAKYLNERVVAIFALVADYRGDLPDLTGINRSYVLLVNELKRLYERNPELNGIKENICWRTFDAIDVIDPYKLWEYSDDFRNHGSDHISKVNSLCILAGKETPDLTLELEKILDEAKASAVAFAESWLIPEYTFDITEEGVLLVNGIEGVMNVRKVQAGSPTEMVLVQAKARPNITFKPDLGDFRLERGLATSLRDLGFKASLKQLFLPVMDNRRGIKFRPKVTRAEATKEQIDLIELDKKLKSLGAETVFDTYNFSL